MKYRGIWALGLCLLVGIGGCRTDFDLFAPYEDIWVVYGVLDPSKDEQGVRVSLAFQHEGDAFVYADTLDPSVGGLLVTMYGAGKTYEGIWRDSLLKDTLSGDFGPYAGAYFFATPDSVALQPGEAYTLEVRNPDEPGFLLRARTRIPPRPRLLDPVVFRDDGLECLPLFSIEDSVRILLQRNPERVPGAAYAFQLEVRMDYRVDAVPRRVSYGPTRLFDKDVRCQWPSDQTICYTFPRAAILRRFQQAVDTSQGFWYEHAPRCVRAFTGFLPQGVQVRAIAVDTVLGRYFEVNSPAFRSLNDVIPEYTNVTGTARAVGIWGSTYGSSTPVGLSPCAEYLMGITQPAVNPCF